MNCYLCLVETGCSSQPAYVLCQRCLAGICREHLVAMGTLSLSGYPPRPHFLCLRCSHLMYPPTTASLLQRDQGSEKGAPISWWRQFWHRWNRRSTPLPTAEQALETVEDYLRQQRDERRGQ
jgi:hypothetical protein